MGITTDREDPGLGKIGLDGQQESYLVLSDEERAKGFVRSLCFTYKHVGPPGPKYPLRDLTADERESHPDAVQYEEYPESEHPKLGRYWTYDQLQRVARGGCGTITTMGGAIAETYARDPSYYSGTYCCGCKTHLPVGERGEFVWVESDGTDGDRVGT